MLRLSHPADDGRRLGALLYIFGGLPGTGKSTLSSLLARQLRVAHLRLDVVEEALRRAGIWRDGPAGYVVLYDLAAANLRLGLDVVADTVNPVVETRQAWRDVAGDIGSPCVEIEVICSDAVERRRRVESRAADIAGFALPSWEDVVRRHYELWREEHIVLDTPGQTVSESFQRLQEALGAASAGSPHA